MELLPSSLALTFALCCAVRAAGAPNYHQIAKFSLPGNEGWDYLIVEPKSHHLFISRGTHTVVVDTETDQVVGDIPDTSGVHGIALAPSLNKGFTSNGRDNSVTVFNLSDLKTIAKVPVDGQNPDCITYDPASKRVFTFNGRSGSATAIDAVTDKVIGSVELGGKPEFAQSDGNGHLFDNLEDKSEVVELDAFKLNVVKRWSIAPGEGPSGLAIDRQRHRIFSVTDGKMVVSDTEAGKVVTTVPIGDGPDAAGYDPALKLAFSSNGQTGTLTVVKQNGSDSYEVAANVPTAPGARTMALDTRTHRIYLVTARFLQPAAGQTEGRRRQMEPGSFTVLVYAP